MQLALQALDEQGIDVERIVRVSNAQGKPAQALHDLMLSASQIAKNADLLKSTLTPAAPIPPGKARKRIK